MTNTSTWYIGVRVPVIVPASVFVVVMTQVQNAERSYSIKTDNRSFERTEKFKCLDTTLTNQNSIEEETKSRLKPGNACYHSVQKLSSSSFYPNI